MKKLILLSFITLTALFCQAQHRKSFALSYGTGMGKILSPSKVPSRIHNGKSLAIFGLGYSSELKQDLFFETGFQFIRYNYTTSRKDIGTFSRISTLKMVSIPFKVRYEKGSHIFFNGGLMVDLSKTDELNGIGTSLGVGFQVKAFKGLSAFINPQANIHSLLNFSGNDYFAEANLAFGLAYRIK